MAEQFRIFHSKVVTFEQCLKKYWWRYISEEPPPAQVYTAAGVLGTGVHRALHEYCRTGEASAGRASLSTYLRMPVHEIAGPGTLHHDYAFKLFEAGCEAIASLESESGSSELETWVLMPARGLQIHARIDRADRGHDGNWTIIDWKTGKYDFDDTTDAQLDIGHLAVRTMRRLPREATVRAVAWNLRTGHQRVRELERGDAAATANRLTAIAAKMQATTDFPATPGPYCSFCEWRDHCPEADGLESGSWAEAAFED